jgi:hypothetical protein
VADDSFEALCEELRADYASGDKGALLRAIHYAILHRRADSLAPYDRDATLAWAAQAFEEAYTYVTRGGARSWDEVFGKPHHTNKKRLRTAQQVSQKYEIYWRVQNLHEHEGVPINDRLFERIGRETGIGGATVVKGLYYRVKSALSKLYGPL